VSASNAIVHKGPTDASPTDLWLYRWGVVLLTGLFALSIVVVLFTTWQIDWALPFIPVLLIAGIAGWWLFQHPLINLAVVLTSFVMIADFEEGIQLTEVFYGLYYMTFLAVWFSKRLFLDPEPVFKRVEEKALWTFLILVTLSLPLTYLFAGTFKLWLGEWLSYSLLGFYFPVKEAIEKDKNGLKVVVGVVLVVGLIILARNGLQYMRALSDASQAWQVIKGRAVTNEGLLMVPAFFAFALYLKSTALQHKVFFAGLFSAFLGGLIVTQSRGYWVAFILGMAVVFWLVPRAEKRRILITSGITVVVVSLAAILILGDFLTLVISGLLDRFLSLGSATTKDISLVNRFLETGAVWEHIKTNPILGHGMGVSYQFYDITYKMTDAKPFIHNGYMALWYKFGVWGPALILSFLVVCVRKGIIVFKGFKGISLESAACLAVVGSFFAFSLSANTSNPFFINDTMFIFAVMTGCAAGCYSRWKSGLSGSTQ